MEAEVGTAVLGAMGLLAVAFDGRPPKLTGVEGTDPPGDTATGVLVNTMGAAVGGRSEGFAVGGLVGVTRIVGDNVTGAGTGAVVGASVVAAIGTCTIGDKEVALGAALGSLCEATTIGLGTGASDGCGTNTEGAAGSSPPLKRSATTPPATAARATRVQTNVMISMLTIRRLLV
jgi:hypothetical protein